MVRDIRNTATSSSSSDSSALSSSASTVVERARRVRVTSLLLRVEGVSFESSLMIVKVLVSVLWSDLLRLRGDIFPLELLSDFLVTSEVESFLGDVTLCL